MRTHRARIQLDMGGRNPLVLLHDADLKTAVTCADDARAPGTDIGPVVDERKLDIDVRYVEVARSQGAEVIGNGRLARATPGHYLRPALLVGTAPADTNNRDEIITECHDVPRRDP